MEKDNKKKKQFGRWFDFALLLGIIVMILTTGCGAAGGRVYVGWEHVDESEKHETADKTWAGRISRAWDVVTGEK